MLARSRRRLAHFNVESFDTVEGHTGWNSIDEAAVYRRRRIMAGGGRIVNDLDKVAALANVTDSGPPAPYPMMSGPLFAVSRDLARLLTTGTGARDSTAPAASAWPMQWLSALHRTERVRKALSRPDGPKRSRFACWPPGDAAVAIWVATASAEVRRPVTLVSTPMFVQHHPWPQHSRPLTNASIVLHGLKSGKQATVASQTAAAIRAMGGAFEGTVRTCGSCLAMGWSSWPGSRINNWTCCGRTRRPDKAERRLRTGARMLQRRVREGDDDTDEWRRFAARVRRLAGVNAANLRRDAFA